MAPITTSKGLSAGHQLSGPKWSSNVMYRRSSSVSIGLGIVVVEDVGDPCGFVLIGEGGLIGVVTEGRCFRQRKAECSAPTGRLFNPSLTMAAQCDLSYNGESDTCTTWGTGVFAPEENIEDGFPFFGGNSRPVIANEIDRALVFIPAADFNRAACFRGIAVGVADQVDENLVNKGFREPSMG